MRIQRNTILALHYVGFLIGNYIVTKYPYYTWIFIVLTALWVFFFEWGLDYLNKRYDSRKSYYFYLAVALLSNGFIAFVVAWIMDTIAAGKERKEVERNFQEN